MATDEWYDSFTGALNLDLKQQTGIQYEVGLQHNLNDTTIVSVTPYRMDLKNEIFFNPASGFFGSNDNYDKTRRIGVEVGQRTDLLKLFHPAFLDKFEFVTNYTYQDPKFLKGANHGKLIPMAPQHQASFGFNFEFLKNFATSLSGRYVGARYAINDTQNITSVMKPYFLTDGRLSFKKNGLEIYGALNNIFDVEYFSFVVKSSGSTTKDHYPAPERNFTIGVKYEF